MNWCFILIAPLQFLRCIVHIGRRKFEFVISPETAPTRTSIQLEFESAKVPSIEELTLSVGIIF